MLTKETKYMLVAALVATIVGLSLICHSQDKCIKAYEEIIEQQQRHCDSLFNSLWTTDEEWDDMIKAIAWQESKWDDKAVGSRNDVGYLQITPIYVAEANRIIGYEHFSLDDRYDRQKSIDIFNTIQAYYNPRRDLHLACKIHNRNAPLFYHKQIQDKYNELQSLKHQEQ